MRRRGGTVPTYEYACTECADRLEVVQSFSDERLSVCPACGGKLRKVFSPVGIVFKGSGFYRTDSRAKDKAQAGAAGGDGAAGKPDAGSDSGKAAADGKADSSSGKDKASPAPASADSGGKGKGKPAGPATGSKVA
jgi:putative FmdB family regulatory protein